MLHLCYPFQSPSGEKYIVMSSLGDNTTVSQFQSPSGEKYIVISVTEAAKYTVKTFQSPFGEKYIVTFIDKKFPVPKSGFNHPLVKSTLLLLKPIDNPVLLEFQSPSGEKYIVKRKWF